MYNSRRFFPQKKRKLGTETSQNYMMVKTESDKIFIHRHSSKPADGLVMARRFGPAFRAQRYVTIAD